VVLDVRTASGQSTFRIGERISLELSFSASEDKRYEITLASYDRSGRMSYEDFGVSPETGWVDPLADYFALGHVGGGLSSAGVLSPKPTIMLLNLNEWIRFDRPGVYSVTVSSRRVRDGRQVDHGSADGGLLRSRPVELHIVKATPEWQEAKLRSILQELNSEPATSGMQPPGRTEAIADLRYLATEGAIDQLAADLREDRSDMMYQCVFGLVGLPESMRAVALKAMNERLDDPHFPISGWFLTALSNLKMDRGRSPQENLERYRRTSNVAWQSALSALPKKEGEARADTVQTLLSFYQAELSPESKAQLGAILSASFLDLPEDRQTSELLWDWDTLRSEAMLPTLQALARRPLNNPGSNLSTAYSRRDLKSAAFKRWYELDSEGAKRQILEELGSGKPSLTAQAVSFLPKEPLPQFESVWAQAFLDSSDYEQETVLASLLVRFGTGTVVAQIASKLDSKVGRWACAPQAAALAYMVKFDSDAARSFLKRAIDARGEGMTACNHSLFQDVSAHAFSPVLTEAALGTLDDADQRVTMDALIYLASYGDKAAQQPIWDRYVKWTATWAGKGGRLEHL
jgi:hypothetical protein